MSFVYPYEFKDYDYGNAKMRGCQMIGVNFATKDTSIKKFIDSYNNFFEITGHSFALKHSSLRERKQTSINPKRVNDKYFQFEVQTTSHFDETIKKFSLYNIRHNENKM